MYKIVIVEDDEMIRQELKQLLENALYEVFCIELFDREDEQIIKENPDLILLDMNLPKDDGLTICSKIRKVTNIPIIFVTSNNTSMDELNCMMRGGDDYVSKPYQPSILLVRIAAVLRRTAPIGDNEKSQLVYKGITLDIVSGFIEKEGEKIELTKTEMKILHYLYLHKESIVSRVEIVEYLWDNQVFIDDNTLSVNITRIRQKLNQIGICDFIETKRGMGYKI